MALGIQLIISMKICSNLLSGSFLRNDSAAQFVRGRAHSVGQLPHAVGPAAHELRGAIVPILSNEERDVRQEVS